MGDFAAFIDGVISRETRENLASFLGRYEHEENGRSRKLSPDEISLITSAVDAFLVDDSFAELGMAEFRNLCERLAVHSEQEELFRDEEVARIRNACFDAMVCIKALEARLSKQADANSIMREHLVMMSQQKSSG